MEIKTEREREGEREREKQSQIVFRWNNNDTTQLKHILVIIPVVSKIKQNKRWTLKYFWRE